MLLRKQVAITQSTQTHEIGSGPRVRGNRVSKSYMVEKDCSHLPLASVITDDP